MSSDIPPLSPSFSYNMSNNPSFVLRKVEDVAYEERPIPEGASSVLIILMSFVPALILDVKSRTTKFSSQ